MPVWVRRRVGASRHKCLVCNDLRRANGFRASPRVNASIAADAPTHIDARNGAVRRKSLPKWDLGVDASTRRKKGLLMLFELDEWFDPDRNVPVAARNASTAEPESYGDSSPPSAALSRLDNPHESEAAWAYEPWGHPFVTFCPDDLPPNWRALYEERAAIREYDGKQTREHVEAAALAEVVAQLTRERLADDDRYGLHAFMRAIEQLVVMTAAAGQTAEERNARIGAYLAGYAERKMDDRWTLERCLADIHARIRQCYPT